MDEHSTSLTDLDLDAWVSIGQRLPVRALGSLALACRTLNHHITQNQSLWSCKFHLECNQTWCQLSGAYDWPAAYRAATVAAHQLHTHHPWKASLSCPPTSNPPSTAKVLLICPKSVDPSWQIPMLAASIDQHLLWWTPSTTLAPFTSSLEVPSPVLSRPGSPRPGGRAHHANPGNDVQGQLDADVAAEPYFVGKRFHSDPQHAHTAFVDTLVRVPAANGIGFASGSRDKTIKLWTPFSNSSRTWSGHIRPLRTLRGHSGSITALLVIPTAPTAGSSTGSSNSSSSARSACDLALGGSPAGTLEIWDVPAVLASASADKAVKIWSLASLHSSSSSGASAAAFYAAAADGAAPSSRWSSSSSSKLSGKGAATSQGRNPLLATLRGHSDCVTDLAVCPTSSSSASCNLLSSSRDCRIKLWDVDSQSCVTTWRMPGPCNKLLPGMSSLSSSPLVTVLSPHSLYVLDPRVPASFGGKSNPAVLRVQWPSGGVLRCAAACNTLLAAGGRKGVRVWDLRAPPPPTISSGDSASCKQHSARLHSSKVATADPARLQGPSSSRRTAAATQSTTSSSTSSSSRVLMTSHLPSGAPVTAVHLDRQRLVAATNKVKLHSGASIAVWSMPDCRRVQLLSSMTTPFSIFDADLVDGLNDGDGNPGNVEDLNDPVQAAAAAAAPAMATAPAAAPETIWELIQSLSDAEAAEALELMHDHLQQQQQHISNVNGFIWQQQQQQQQQQGLQQVEHDQPESDPDASNLDQGSSGTGLDSSSSSSSEADGWQQQETEVQGTYHRPVHWGHIEPGVMSMTLCGPVLATVNTLGNVLLRDFSRGSVPLKALESCRMSSDAQQISSSGAGASGPDVTSVTGNDVELGETANDEAATTQVLSKFWRA